MSDSSPAAPPLSASLNVRLSAMMFLQYAIWGAWLPLLWPFLSGHRGFEGSEIGDMFAVGAIGAIIAPFIAGQIADRYFSTERFLGVSHILGGLLIWQLANLETYKSFLVFSLLYSLIYSPTLPLTNSLAFHHLPIATVTSDACGCGHGRLDRRRHRHRAVAPARAHPGGRFGPPRCRPRSRRGWPAPSSSAR